MNYVEQTIKAEELRIKSVKARQKLIDDAEYKASQMVKVPTEEKEYFEETLKQVQELNEETYIYQGKIDELPSMKEDMNEMKYKSLMNEYVSKKDVANSKAWYLKKDMKRLIEKYRSFTVQIPSIERPGWSDAHTYKYKKVDPYLLKLEERINDTRSYSENMAYEYKKRFGIHSRTPWTKDFNMETGEAIR